MTLQIEIHRQREPDVPALFALAQAAFAAVPGWSGPRTLAALRRDVVFVAREHDLPAGFVALSRESADTIVVEQLLVAPGHEHRGIGHRLLAHAEGYAIAESAKTLAIVVEEDNWRARSFYQKSGFVPVERELLELVLPRLA